MARPARSERSRSARPSRQLSRFYHSINPDRVSVHSLAFTILVIRIRPPVTEPPLDSALNRGEGNTAGRPLLERQTFRQRPTGRRERARQIVRHAAFNFGDLSHHAPTDASTSAPLALASAAPPSGVLA